MSKRRQTLWGACCTCSGCGCGRALHSGGACGPLQAHEQRLVYRGTRYCRRHTLCVQSRESCCTCIPFSTLVASHRCVCTCPTALNSVAATSPAQQGKMNTALHTRGQGVASTSAPRKAAPIAAARPCRRVVAAVATLAAPAPTNGASHAVPAQVAAQVRRAIAASHVNRTTTPTAVWRQPPPPPYIPLPSYVHA